MPSQSESEPSVIQVIKGGKPSFDKPSTAPEIRQNFPGAYLTSRRSAGAPHEAPATRQSK